MAHGLNGLKAAYAYLGDPAPLTEVIAELQPLQRRLGDLAGLEWSVFESAFPFDRGRELGPGQDWHHRGDRDQPTLRVRRRPAPSTVATSAGSSGCRAAPTWPSGTAGTPWHSVKQTSHGWWHPIAVGMLADTLIDLGRRDEAAQLLIGRRVSGPARAARGSPAALPRPAGRGHRFTGGAGRG